MQKFHCITTLDCTFIGIQGNFAVTGYNNEEAIINSLTNNHYMIDNEYNSDNTGWLKSFESKNERMCIF